MNIVLVETSGAIQGTGRFLRHSVLEPFALECLGGALTAAGHTVTIIQQRTLSNDQVLDRLYLCEPDVVGFSCYTFNFENSVTLARLLKNTHRDAIVVFGGYHASACPNVVADPAIDYVVIGEGEQTLVELVAALTSGRDTRGVPGLAYSTDAVQFTSPRARIANLDALPRPLRVAEYLRDARIESLMHPTASLQRNVAQMYYSRGCPNSCTYCCSPRMYGPTVTFRSARHVVDEMEYLCSEFNTNCVYFTDLTFNSSRQRVLSLCHEIIGRRLDVKWFCECRPDHLDEEVVSQMVAAGCTKIAFGVESLSEDTLRAYGSGHARSLPDIARTLDRVDRAGIIVRGFMMMGFPDEDRAYLQTLGARLAELPIDDIRLGFLTPYPGTRLYDDVAGVASVAGKNWDEFTSETPFIPVPGIRPAELLALQTHVYSQFYGSAAYATRRAKKIQQFPHLARPFDEFSLFLHERGVTAPSPFVP
jgi:anaerobic magnesium-protoporphyrin IX monomethyl ester cyclase